MSTLPNPLTLPDRFLAGRAGVRIVSDIHGDFDALRAAVVEADARNLAVLCVGDLTDRGPASADVLREVLARRDAGTLAFTPGNHCWKLARHLMGRTVTIGHGLDLTIAQLAAAPDEADLRRRTVDAILDSPLWVRMGRVVVAHAAFAMPMLAQAPLTLGDARARKVNGFLVDQALYGEKSGALDADGIPNRTYGWRETVPNGITVVVGHDVLGDVPVRYVNEHGGEVLHIDTGAGKGGRLSWVDYSLEQLGSVWQPAAAYVDAAGEPLLTVLCGPSGSGKSTWAAANFAPDVIVSSDAIRQEMFGDFRCQSDPGKVFATFFARAQERLSRGLPVVLDAMHLRARERKLSYALVPEDAPVRLVLIDRPLADKLRDGGWRLEFENLIQRHHETYQSSVRDALEGDHRPNVRVLDLRRT